MMFAQWQNHLMTYYSKHMPVVKGHMTVCKSTRVRLLAVEFRSPPSVTSCDLTLISLSLSSLFVK